MRPKFRVPTFQGLDDHILELCRAVSRPEDLGRRVRALRGDQDGFGRAYNLPLCRATG